MKKLPNFLIVGAAKSGTTSIYDYLNQHPDIYIPKKKECRFFSDIPLDFVGPDTPQGRYALEKDRATIVKNIDDYVALFDGVTSERAIGDVSPDYLYYYENSIRNIKRALGDKVKIVMILRDPVERAFSNYMHLVREKLDTLSFEEAIQAELDKIRNNWWWGYHLVAPGFYHSQVKVYLENFENVKICLYEDLEQNALGMMEEMYTFLGVDSRFKPDVAIRHNATGMHRSKAIDAFLHGNSAFSAIARSAAKWALSKPSRDKVRYLLNRANLKKPRMNDKTRAQLRELYRDDILMLEKLIGRDLHHWR